MPVPTKCLATAAAPVRLVVSLWVAFWQLSVQAQSTAETSHEARLAYSAQSPAWLRTVGKLDVPGYRIEQGRRVHHRENCTATLLGTSEDARHIVTAWHCLEYYQDLSMKISFSLPHFSPHPVVRQARRLADGGGMSADWAILELIEPVAFGPVPALTFDGGQDTPEAALVMAGYSRDAGLGGSGETLTYHKDCRELGQYRGYALTNCQAYKGASGGPVVRYSSDGIPYLAGVISEGNGEDTSTYVPVARFRASLKRLLN